MTTRGTSPLHEVNRQVLSDGRTRLIARHLSQTGNLMQIYTDPGLFEARVAAARA